MFLADMNRRYAVKANKQQDLHRPVDAQVKLEEVLCVQEERVVGQDWCVLAEPVAADREGARWIEPGEQRVRVKQRAGGELIVSTRASV